MPGGRPRKFNSPEEMQVKIEEYFAKCDSATKFVVLKDEKGAQHVEEVPSPARYTVPGLAYFLGFCARTELADYARDYREFSDTISRARLKIEEQRITDGADPDTRNSNGIKFDLSNNFNYKDLQQIEVIGEVNRVINTMVQAIRESVPEELQTGIIGKIQAAIDFDK